MEVLYTPHFRRSAKKISPGLRVSVERAVALFVKDPFHSSLDTHKLTGQLKGCWAFSVTESHRIIFEFVGEKKVVFHEVGDQGIYHRR